MGRGEGKVEGGDCQGQCRGYVEGKGGGQGKSEGENQCCSEGSRGGHARARKKSNDTRKVSAKAAVMIKDSAKMQGAMGERVEAEARDKDEAEIR